MEFDEHHHYDHPENDDQYAGLTVNKGITWRVS